VGKTKTKLSEPEFEPRAFQEDNYSHLRALCYQSERARLLLLGRHAFNSGHK
jgi:hypothetical protein